MSIEMQDTLTSSTLDERDRSLLNRQKQTALLVCILCIGAPLALGSVHPKVHGIWALSCLLILFPFVQSRRGHHHPFSLPWLWGSFLLIMGASFSLIPLPQSILSFLSSPIAHEWKSLPPSIQGWSSLSLSPIHTIHWINQQWVWIWVAYMSYHFHSFRKPLLWCLSCLGPLLVFVSSIHALFDLQYVYGLYQSADRGHLSGMISGMVNPNTTASLCLLSMSVAFGMSTHWRSLLYTQPKLNLTYQAAWLLDFFGTLSLVGIGWSGSRGAGLCAFGILIFLLGRRSKILSSGLSSKGKRYGLILGSLALGLGGLFFLYIYNDSFIEHTETFRDPLLSLSKSSNIESTLHQKRPYLHYPRFQTWSDTLNLIRHYGFWGSGRGSFGEVFTSFQSFIHPGWVSHPENHVLQHLSEAGFIGLLGGVLWPILFWIIWINRAWRKAHDTAWGLWVGVGGVALHQSFDFGFEGLGLSIPVGIGWGLLWSYLAPSIKQSRQRRQRPKLVILRLLSLVCLLCTLATLSLTYRTLTDDLLDKEYTQTTFQSSELSSLLKYHPRGGFLAFNIARLLYKTGQDPLSWITQSHRLMPKHGESYRLEAHYYKDLELYTLAQHSFRSAIETMPWKRRYLYKELNQLPLSPFNVLPDYLRGDFIYSLTKIISLDRLSQRILELPESEWQANLKLRRFMIHVARKQCVFDHFKESQLSQYTQMQPERQLDYILVHVFKALCSNQSQDALRLLKTAPVHLRSLPLYPKMIQFLKSDASL
jgi:hypothetical protein